MSNSEKGSKVLKNSIIYTVSGLLIKCFNLFLLPLYTVYLTTSDYGVTSIATSFLNTMSYIVTFSLFSAVMRFFVDLKEDPEKLKRFYGTIVNFVFLSGGFFFLLLTVLQKPLSRYVFSGVDYFPVIAICLVSMVTNCQHLIYENILRSQQKATKCAILSICYFCVIIGGNLLLVVVLKMGAAGVLLATLLASGLYTLFFVVDMYRSGQMVCCFDVRLLKDALKYSIPIMPHDLSPQIADLVAKALLGGTTSLGAVGIYSIAAQFGTVSDTVQGYVNNAYAPWFYERLHQKQADYKASIRKMVNTLIDIIGLFFIGVALFAQDYILLFMDPSYAEAWRFVPLVVLRYIIKTPCWFYINTLLYNKSASKVLFVATLTSSLVDVLLACFMIPAWSAYGAVTADIIAVIVRALIVIMISKRHEDVGLRIRDFLVYILRVVVCIFAGLAPACFVFGSKFSIWGFAIKIIVVLIYVAAILLKHREVLLSILHRFLHRKVID